MVGAEMEPVLVGVDGSESSLRAAAWAVGLARAWGTGLIGVYVHQGPAAFAASVPGAASSMREATAATATQLGEAAVERMRELGIQGSFLERSGDPHTQLVELARDLRAAAVVVGASEKRAHRVAGSVGARLIHSSPCPVVVVP